MCIYQTGYLFHINIEKMEKSVNQLAVKTSKTRRAVFGQTPQNINVPPGTTFSLACVFFGIQVARILLRPGDFVTVTCQGRSVVVFNSFLAFNRGTINLRRGEFVTFFGSFS
jgi:hypothetical protein